MQRDQARRRCPRSGGSGPESSKGAADRGRRSRIGGGLMLLDGAIEPDDGGGPDAAGWNKGARGLLDKVATRGLLDVTATCGLLDVMATCGSWTWQGRAAWIPDRPNLPNTSSPWALIQSAL
jgi:hypothetical protein